MCQNECLDNSVFAWRPYSRPEKKLEKLKLKNLSEAIVKGLGMF